VLLADHDVAELARPARRPRFVDGKGEDVGGAVDRTVPTIERLDLGGTDERDREMEVAVYSGGLERRRRGRLEARRWLRRVDDLDLDQALLRRRSGACDSAYLL
jgi:hypothetical protein